MKLVHAELTMRLADGGVVRAVLDLCTALADRGHEVTLLTCDDEDVPESWKRDEPGRPRVVVLSRPALPLGLFSRAQLEPARRAIEDADALHLHGAWTPSNLQFARIARRAGTPYFLSVHGMLDDWTIAHNLAKKKLFLRLGGRRMYERAAAVHCTAAAELTQSQKWFPRGRGEVVPLFLDLDEFESLPGPDPARTRWPVLASGEPTVLFLSRIHVKKGLERLIDAVGQLHAEGLPAHLLIAGSGDPDYEASLRRHAEPLGEHAHFLGFVTGIDRVSLLQAADVFALPSAQENFGYAMFEALAAGTPAVISREVDTWPELVESGGAAAVEREPPAIAAALRALLEDPAARADMGREGRRWVLENLNPGAVVARYEDLYRTATRGPR